MSNFLNVQLKYCSKQTNSVMQLTRNILGEEITVIQSHMRDGFAIKFNDGCEYFIGSDALMQISNDEYIDELERIKNERADMIQKRIPVI